MKPNRNVILPGERAASRKGAGNGARLGIAHPLAVLTEARVIEARTRRAVEEELLVSMVCRGKTFSAIGAPRTLRGAKKEVAA